MYCEWGAGLRIFCPEQRDKQLRVLADERDVSSIFTGVVAEVGESSASYFNPHTTEGAWQYPAEIVEVGENAELGRRIVERASISPDNPIRQSLL